MLEVEQPEVVVINLVVVVSIVEVDIVPEVVQLLEDDVVRLEVEHAEVARCSSSSSSSDVLLLEVVEVLSGLEVDVIT